MEDLQKGNNPKNRESNEVSEGHTSLPTQIEVKSVEEKLLEANPLIFKGVAPEKKQQIVTTVSQLIFHQGPLPDPDQLVGYDGIIKNGAERIMVMAEDNLKANIEFRRENQSLSRFHSMQTFNVIKTGQWMGFGLVLFFVSLGAYMCSNGHETFGQTLISTTLVTIPVILYHRFRSILYH